MDDQNNETSALDGFIKPISAMITDAITILWQAGFKEQAHAPIRFVPHKGALSKVARSVGMALYEINTPDPVLQSRLPEFALLPLPIPYVGEIFETVMINRRLCLDSLDSVGQPPQEEGDEPESYDSEEYDEVIDEVSKAEEDAPPPQEKPSQG